MALNIKRENSLLKVSRLILLLLVALLVTNTAQAASAITGCIRDVFGNQIDLRTGQTSFAPEKPKSGTISIKAQEIAAGSWQLVIDGAKQGTISLQTQANDAPPEVKLLPETDPIYISALIQHQDDTSTFEIYAFKSLKRLISITGIAPCPQCIQWDVAKRRVAMAAQLPPGDKWQLWLIAPDTSTIRKFDLTAIAKSKARPVELYPNEMWWSPDGRHLAYVSSSTIPGFLAVNAFSMDGTYQIDLELQTLPVARGEGYKATVVQWAGDSRRFFYLHLAPAPDKICPDTCDTFFTVYSLDTRQAKQLAQLGENGYTLNAAGTRALYRLGR